MNGKISHLRRYAAAFGGFGLIVGLFLYAVAASWSTLPAVQMPMAPLPVETAAASPPTVILDAGHGGEDGGAVSAGGLAEKSLNLSIVLTLGDMLRAAGVDVIYTRTEDDGLYEGAIPGHRKMTDLKNRLSIRNAHPEALFLSVHMNTFSDPQYDGMQLFYTAGSENSHAAAELLRQANRTYLQPDNTRVCKEATSAIYLLDRADPAGTTILAECGFLSNPEEAARLATPAYREKVAAVLCAGILEYLNTENTEKATT